MCQEFHAIVVTRTSLHTGSGIHQQIMFIVASSMCNASWNVLLCYLAWHTHYCRAWSWPGPSTPGCITQLDPRFNLNAWRSHTWHIASFIRMQNSLVPIQINVYTMICVHTARIPIDLSSHLAIWCSAAAGTHTLSSPSETAGHFSPRSPHRPRWYRGDESLPADDTPARNRLHLQHADGSRAGARTCI